MINPEVAISLVAMLVTFFIVIYLLQKGRRRKKRIAQDMETLELAKVTRCDVRDQENMESMGLSPLNLARDGSMRINLECRAVMIFGVLMFIGFLGWSVYLFSQGLMGLATGNIIYAVFAMVILVFAKSKILHGIADLGHLQGELEKYTTALDEGLLDKPVSKAALAPKRAAPVSAPVSDQRPLAELYALAEGYANIPEDSTLKRHFLSKIMAEVEAGFAHRPTDSALKRHHDGMVNFAFQERLESLPPLKGEEREPVVVSEPEAVAKVEPALTAQVFKAKNPYDERPVSALLALADGFAGVPEDSTLKRHFVSRLMTEVEAGFPPRPSDSMLKRHHDAMVDTAFQERLAAMAPVAAVKAVVKATAALVDNQRIPEDSMLRRHFISHIRSTIEAGLAPRPTDFNLRRHYKQLVESLLDQELQDHYI